LQYFYLRQPRHPLGGIQIMGVMFCQMAQNCLWRLL
jgi:hypothetical protein